MFSSYKFRLSEKSKFYEKLLQIEQLYDELGVSVQTTGSVIITDRNSGKQFIVGRQEDYESFPRQTDVPFYLMDEEA